MSAEVFLDTNILLYACSSAAEDAEKKRRAGELILEGNFALSAQVLQEFISNALRKPALGIGESVIDATLELASQVPVQPVDLEVVIRSTTLRRRHQISHWDATIVAAAQTLGCHTLYSEDLSHDRVLDGLRVVNPFR
ncbi:MAG: PIN domain-containing protein [Verrucomicrobiales bacterium]|nr:PIN domain-containing protein [Verrucomicrobiales bacterium]